MTTKQVVEELQTTFNDFLQHAESEKKSHWMKARKISVNLGDMLKKYRAMSVADGKELKNS